MLTNEQILKIWEREHGALTESMRLRFLRRPELHELRKLEPGLVLGAIADFPKLEAALRVALTRTQQRQRSSAVRRSPQPAPRGTPNSPLLRSSLDDYATVRYGHQPRGGQVASTLEERCSQCDARILPGNVHDC